VWTVMIAAMMLPSAVPLLQLFVNASTLQARSRTALASFVAGYVAVWALFGWVALAVDGVVHRTVEGVSWLADRPWVMGAGTLALAGAFQFSGLKDRCLTECRHPAAYLLRHYRRGPGSAFRLGWGHGLYCLGCCWALMLVMLAAGLSDLRWMAALGALMAYEKVGRHGRAASAAAGVVLLVLGVAVAVGAESAVAILTSGR
jgi:predicted metal-binding membrane protein